MTPLELLEALEQAQPPQQLQLCCVNGTKKPYHPDQKYLPSGKPDPTTPDWKTPLLRHRIVQEIQKGKCLAVGLLTGEVSNGIMAVDHDGLSCDPLIEKLSGLSIKKALPKTGGFTSGKEGRYQLLYQVPEYFWPYVKSKVVLTGVKGADNKEEQLDLRWNGKQSTFVGTHPETGAYHYLPGQSPTEIKVASCPLWIIRQILSFHSLLPKVRKDWCDRDWALEYLSYILNQDLDWYEYRDVLFGLHYSGVEEEIAWVWSASSDKHTDAGFDAIWKYIDDDCVNPIGLGSLGRLAKQGGRNGKSPHSHPSEYDQEETKTELIDLMDLEKIHCPNVLPDDLYKPLSKLAQRLNLPVEAYVSVLLTVASTQLKVKNRLAIDPSTGFYVPPIIWIGVVGESGSKKSPLIKALLSPLDGLQEKAEEDYQTKLEEFEAKLEEWNESEKGNRGKKPKDKPIPREYYLSDFTMEALVEVLVRQKEDGLLIFIEELARFFNAMDAYRSGKGGDRQQWLSSYDGGPVKSNRKTTGRGYVPRTNISIAGGIQPSIVQKIMMSDTSVEDGLWARLAWVKTPLSIAQGISGDTRYDLTDLLAALYKKLNQLEGGIYRFSLEAQALWNDWHFEIESKILKEPSNILRATLPKAKERAARIALICHLIHAAIKDEQPSTDISAETLAAATQFNRWLMGQTRLLYAELGVADNPETVKILKFVKRFQGCGWITAKMVRSWTSATQKPSLGECREFMTKMVNLGYAETNGKQGSEYKIKITHIVSHLVTNTPQPPSQQEIQQVT